MAGNRNANLTFTVLGKDKSASKTLTGVGSEADKVGKRLGVMGVAAGAALANVGVAAAAAGVSFATDFVGQSITAASDLNETLSKVGVLFGDQADKITTFAETAGTAFGQTKQQALDAASTFAVFGKSAGLSGDKLTDFAVNMTGLASDLASFNNTTPEDAIQAIGAALRGEMEPIRRYGVLLDDASLRQEALAQGLIKTTKQALTPQQKVLAAQALILKQTTAAQGDFARTSDGLANQQRILSAEFDNAKSSLGSALLPALTNLAKFATGTLIPAVKQLAEWVSVNLGPAFTRLGEWATSTLIPAMQSMAATFQKDVWPALQRVYKVVWENLKPAIDSLGQLWSETLQPALVQAMPYIQMWAKWFGVTWAAAVTLGSWLIGKLVPIIAKVVEHIVRVTQMQGKVVAAFAGMAQGIYNAFRSAFNGIASLWNKTVGALSFSLPSWVPGIGGKGFDVPDIPMLAKGGIVTRPTLALIGEAGPEAVVPLSRGGGYGGGMVVNVNVTQPLGTPEQIARAVTDAFRKAGRGGAVAASF